MQNKNSFLGKGWAFPPEFSHNDNPTRMSNYEEDIRQSLIILLSLAQGSEYIVRITVRNYIVISLNN